MSTKLDTPPALCFAVENWSDLGLAAPINRHGNSLRIWARPVEGLRIQGLTYACLGETAWGFLSDEPAERGGGDNAPSPGALLETGMIATYMNEIHAAAEVHEIDLHEIELTLDSYYLLPGSNDRLAVQALPLELGIQLASSVTGDELRDALLAALRSAPYHGLLRQSRPLELTAGKRAEIDPATAFEQVRAATPLDEATVSTLHCRAPQQSDNRAPEAGGAFQLHGHARCRLRADGVKEIEHTWLSWPTAKAFRLLSDEPEGFGGRGLAPDATTYVAAGLALSVATELSRHAAVREATKIPPAVRLDVHFPFGGLVQAGIANSDMDPLEAAVALGSDGGEERIREILGDVARTSIAHAVCNDKLATNIRIRLL